MASQVPFKKNTAADIGLSLYLNTGALVTNPGTITAKISKDFGDYADVGTVTEEDSTYGQIKLALTNTEMNADVVMLYVVDNTSGCVPWTATIYTAANLLDDIKTDTAAILADTGTDGVLVAAAAATAVADATLKRDLDQVEGTAPVHSLTGAALKLVSKVDDDGAGSLVTYKTNGTDPFSEQAITTGASLEPIDSLGIATAP